MNFVLFNDLNTDLQIKICDMYEDIYLKKQYVRGKILRCIRKLIIFQRLISNCDTTLEIMSKCGVVIVKSPNYNKYWRPIDWTLYNTLLFINLHRQGYNHIILSKNKVDGELNILSLWMYMLQYKWL